MTKEIRHKLISDLLMQYQIAKETRNQELYDKTLNRVRWALLTLEEVELLNKGLADLDLEKSKQESL